MTPVFAQLGANNPQRAGFNGRPRPTLAGKHACAKWRAWLKARADGQVLPLCYLLTTYTKKCIQSRPCRTLTTRTTRTLRSPAVVTTGYVTTANDMSVNCWASHLCWIHHNDLINLYLAMCSLLGNLVQKQKGFTKNWDSHSLMLLWSWTRSYKVEQRDSVCEFMAMDMERKEPLPRV